MNRKIIKKMDNQISLTINQNKNETQQKQVLHTFFQGRQRN